MAPFVLAIIALLCSVAPPRQSSLVTERRLDAVSAVEATPSGHAAGEVGAAPRPTGESMRAASSSRCSLLVLFVLPSLLSSYWLKI